MTIKTLQRVFNFFAINTDDHKALEKFQKQFSGVNTTTINNILSNQNTTKFFTLCKSLSSASDVSVKNVCNLFIKLKLQTDEEKKQKTKSKTKNKIKNINDKKTKTTTKNDKKQGTKSKT